MGGRTSRRGRRSLRCGFSFHICRCLYRPPRLPTRHKLTVQQPKGRASRPRHAATRCDRRAAHRARYRQPRPIRHLSAFAGAAPEWRGHSCLRASTRAGRNVCHTLPRSITAASRDGVAPPALARLCESFPGTRRQTTTPDDNQPQSTSACIRQTGALLHDYIPPLQG